MRSPHVDAADPDACAVLEETVAVVLAHGGVLHPALRIRERDRRMSLHADVDEGSLLVSIPDELLVPVAALAGDADQRFVVTDEVDVTPVQRRLAACFAALYTATHKQAWARTGLPSVAIEDGPARSALRSMRAGPLGGSRSLVDAFLATRKLGRADGAWLMPVVDLLNHHRHGDPFGGERGVTVHVRRPLGDTECFGRYHPRLDPLDQALAFGFTDPSVPFARSAPVAVDGGALGDVQVLGPKTRPRSPLDPPTVRLDDDCVVLSHLTFHAGHPGRLPEVLRLAVTAVLRRRCSSADPTRVTAELLEAVAEENLQLISLASAALVREAPTPATQVVADALGVLERNLRAATAALRSWVER